MPNSALPRVAASAPAWVGVVLSIIATLVAAINWQRNEDLGDIEQKIVEHARYEQEHELRTRNEIDQLREDNRELRQFLFNMCVAR